MRNFSWGVSAGAGFVGAGSVIVKKFAVCCEANPVVFAPTDGGDLTLLPHPTLTDVVTPQPPLLVPHCRFVVGLCSGVSAIGVVPEGLVAAARLACDANFDGGVVCFVALKMDLRFSDVLGFVVRVIFAVVLGEALAVGVAGTIVVGVSVIFESLCTAEMANAEFFSEACTFRGLPAGLVVVRSAVESLTVAFFV